MDKSKISNHNIKARIIFPADSIETMDVSLMEKFYSKLFGAPKEYISAGILSISIILASILNGSGLFFSLRYVVLSLVTLVALFLFRRSFRLAVNKRRLIFFVMVVIIFIEVFDILSVYILGKDLIVLAPASITALLTVVFYFTSESSEIKSATASLILALLLYPVSYYFSFQAPHRTVGYLITAIAGLMMGYLFIRYLDRNFEFFNVKRFLKAFLLFWLTCDAKYFERELKDVAIKRRGWVKCLKIGKAKLISTSFHPGPMRNIGGAKLVGAILNSIDNSMFLHTAVGHELNPIDEDNVRKIVFAVRCDGKRLRANLPYELEGERFILSVFPFEDVKLMIIIGKFASDDFPYELNDLVGSDIMFVEAHSAHRPNFDIGKEDVEEARRLIEEAKKIKTGETDLRYFFKRAKIETKNICGYVAILILDYGKEKHAILMLDGNNVDLNFRREIEGFCKDYGIKATVISTDNHSKTGISPKIGYKPVGADEEDRKAVFKFLKDVLENFKLEPCKEVEYGYNEVEVEVMGKRFFELVDLAFRNMGEKAIYLLFAMIIFQFILTWVLGWMIV